MFFVARKTRKKKARLLREYRSVVVSIYETFLWIPMRILKKINKLTTNDVVRMYRRTLVLFVLISELRCPQGKINVTNTRIFLSVYRNPLRIVF